MKKSIKPGKIIIPAHVFPERHELETANVFVALGLDVEFLAPTYVKGVFFPDILMDGKVWEMKSPCGANKLAIEKHFRKAAKQSAHIIFDLRRIEFQESIAISKIKREFSMRHGRVKKGADNYQK